MAEYDSSEKIAVHCQQARVVWEHVPSYLAEQLEEIWAGKGKNLPVPTSVMMSASGGTSVELL